MFGVSELYIDKVTALKCNVHCSPLFEKQSKKMSSAVIHCDDLLARTCTTSSIWRWHRLLHV